MQSDKKADKSTKIDPKMIEGLRKYYELPHQWQLRKEFLQIYSDRFDADRLICLSNVFINVECVGVTYPEEVMKLIKELGSETLMMTHNTSLLQWLATFKLDGQPSVDPQSKNAYASLVDGYICARILNQISPRHFSDQWLEGIKPVPPDGSWRLRVSNLNRINSKIHDYTSELQSSKFKPSAIVPDFAVIAMNFHPDQISRLIQLILFCAITCGKQQDYIERIHNLPTQVKEDIKKAIEELLIKNNDTSQEFNDSVNRDSDMDMTSTPIQRLNLNSSTTISPSRSSVYRSLFRRTSSQSSTGVSRKSEQLDTSAVSNHEDENLEDVKQRLNDALLVKEEKTQACHDLEQKLKQLQLERDQLAYENEKLVGERGTPTFSQIPIKSTGSPFKTTTRRSSAIDSRDEDSRLKSSDDDNSQALIVRNRRLQDELNEYKRKNIKIESEKEEYMLKSKLLQDDLDKITAKHEELRYKAELANRLQDRLDEQEHLSEKVINYEGTIENLIKKNNDMKKELKNLEDKNKSHIIQVVGLEENNSKLTADLSAMKIYQKQLKDAQAKLSQETYRADKAEVEVTRLTDKYLAAKKENEKLYETTNQLMRNSGGATNRKASGSSGGENSNNREFDSVNLKSANLVGSSRVSNKTLFEENLENDQENEALNSMSTSVIELREKVARLEYENKLLQNKVAAKRDNDQTVLGGLLESANTRCTKLELEKRQLCKKILLLEGHLKDLNNSQNGASTSSAIIHDSSSDNTLALINRVEELQRLLLQKDQELLESDAKYKKNLQKAKDVIKTLNSNQSINSSLHPSCMSSTSSFNSSSLDEVNMLKQQLKERDERFIELERKFYEFKKLKEIHERLIISAFYGLTTPMQWKNANRRVERTSLTSPPNTASSSINHSKHSH